MAPFLQKLLQHLSPASLCSPQDIPQKILPPGGIFKEITGRDVSTCKGVEEIYAAIENATGKKIKTESCFSSFVPTPFDFPIIEMTSQDIDDMVDESLRDMKKQSKKLSQLSKLLRQ